MVGTLDVGNSYTATLTVTNGLTLNGVALIGNPTNATTGQFSFTGSQTLGGNGSILLENYLGATCLGLMVANPATTLTIAPGITVHGKFGAVGYNSCSFGVTNVYLQAVYPPCRPSTSHQTGYNGLAGMEDTLQLD